jgi:thiamine kinase-like enzyme
VHSTAQHLADARERLLRPLLDHLAAIHSDTGAPRIAHTWQAWQITPVGGGMNNLLYRVTGAAGDLAVKFTKRDGRDRAGHEYGALRALAQAGLDLAPAALLLDRGRYALPVVVQTWLPGEASERLPGTEDEWSALLEHLVRVHGVTPEQVDVHLDPPPLDANSAVQARENVRWQMARVPLEAQPDSLLEILGRLEADALPAWPAPPLGLCRCDNNLRNYIRRPGTWASVDWEYSGWGDPAFDVAQWATHASYTDVPLSRWDWALEAYVRRAGELGRRDPTLELRVRTYYRMMVVWWLARLARYLYEVPAGLDARLTPWAEGWEENMRLKYAHYLALAERLYT